MVVSLAILPLSQSIFLGICKGSGFKCWENNDNEVKNSSSRVFLRVDNRRPFCILKANRRHISFKPQLTCVASDNKRWRNKSGGESWNFKTTARLVEHTYNSARDHLLEAEGLRCSLTGCREQEEQVDSTTPRISVASTTSSSSWESANSSTVFATSRFGFLLGVVMTIFGAVTVAGLAFGRWWNRLRWPASQERKLREPWTAAAASAAFETPSAFSFFLKKDLKRKETVEWVNMILGKLWKVYRRGLETWLVGLLQPLIDNLKKPSYVRRVKIQNFYLGDEPLSVRSVERKTSRRADDLQYQIGLRYTGEAKMLLSITLAAGFVPIVIPVGVRGLDVDGEIWVKLRLIPSEPWVGTATWAFVSLPKIILALAPFGLLNIMTIPFISRFLTKLLTEDLPQLFVKPNKIVINFLNNSKNPFAKEFRDEAVNGNDIKDFAGELSVTLVDARKLKYFPIGRTDPYVVLTLGDQVIRSKKNSQTSIIGPPGAPIWNQDFQLLVVDPKAQKLFIRVRDIVGLGVFTVGYGEVDLSTLQDTVPTDKVVRLRGGWGLPKRFSGEILLRLTYKAYVEDEEAGGYGSMISDSDSDSEKDEFSHRRYYSNKGKIGFIKDLFSAVNTVIRDLGYENVDVQPSHFQRRKVEPDGNEPVPKSPRIQPERSDVSPTTNAAVQTPRTEKNGAVMWLGVATGIALLAALSLNFSNLLNF